MGEIKDACMQWDLLIDVLQLYLSFNIYTNNKGLDMFASASGGISGVVNAFTPQTNGEFLGGLAGSLVGTGLGALGEAAGYSIAEGDFPKVGRYPKVGTAIALLSGLGLPITTTLLGRAIGLAVDPKKPDIVFDVVATPNQKRG